MGIFRKEKSFKAGFERETGRENSKRKSEVQLGEWTDCKRSQTEE